MTPTTPLDDNPDLHGECRHEMELEILAEMRAKPHKSDGERVLLHLIERLRTEVDDANERSREAHQLLLEVSDTLNQVVNKADAMFTQITALKRERDQAVAKVAEARRLLGEAEPK